MYSGMGVPVRKMEHSFVKLLQLLCSRSYDSIENLRESARETVGGREGERKHALEHTLVKLLP